MRFYFRTLWLVGIVYLLVSIHNWSVYRQDQNKIKILKQQFRMEQQLQREMAAPPAEEDDSVVPNPLEPSHV